MIKKLLLVRVPKITSTRLVEAELTRYISNYDTPLNISPVAWDEEAGLSHYGWLMELKLKELELVNARLHSNPDVTLLDLVVVKKERSVDDTLKTVGLRIHPSAE